MQSILRWSVNGEFLRLIAVHTLDSAQLYCACFRLACAASSCYYRSRKSYGTWSTSRALINQNGAPSECINRIPYSTQLHHNCTGPNLRSITVKSFECILGLVYISYGKLTIAMIMVSLLSIIILLSIITKLLNYSLLIYWCFTLNMILCNVTLSNWPSLRKITWLNSQQPKTRGHVEHLSNLAYAITYMYLNRSNEMK